MGHNVNYLVNGDCFIPIKRQQSKYKEQSEISCLLDTFEEVSQGVCVIEVLERTEKVREQR